MTLRPKAYNILNEYIALAVINIVQRYQKKRKVGSMKLIEQQTQWQHLLYGLIRESPSILIGRLIAISIRSGPASSLSGSTSLP